MSASNEGEAGKLGPRVRALRRERFPNETAARFAQRLDMKPAALSRIERGRVEPSLPTCRKLAEALGVSLADVLGE